MSRTGAGVEWRLEEHASLPSTSDLARARAEAGAAAGLAVLAQVQTAGRGRQGRRWVAPAGNLNLSVVLRPRHGEPGHWALACGVALAEAVGGFLPGLAAGALCLKWPNDLLLNGGKLAGILVETGPGWLVAGFGVNLRMAPVLAEARAVCLAEIADPPAPRVLAEALLARLGHWEGVLEAGAFASVRTAWLARGLPEGTPLRVHRGAGLVEGMFAGLAEDGALLLAGPGGLARVAGGDVLAGAG